MRRPRLDLVVLLLAVAAFVVGNIWLGRRAVREVSGIEILPVPSVLNGGPSGLRGIYVLWRELGCEPRLWRQPLTALRGQPAAGGLMVVAAPFLPGFAPTAEERAALAAWAREGGTVVLLGAEEEALASHFGLRLRPGVEARRRAAPAAPTGLMTGVERLSLGQDSCIPQAGPAVVHARGPHGPAIVSLPLGKGQVVVVADATALANGAIREADNAVLAANLGALARGRVWFDEYHHGLREGRGLAHVLARPPFLWVTLQAAFALALFLHAASRRFGPPRPAREGPAFRASTEYVAAMASLYRSAGAQGAALARLAQGFRREVVPALGLPPSAPAETLAMAIAHRAGVDPQRLLRVLQLCEGQGADEARPKEALVLWAGSELETMRRQVLP